MPFNYAAFKKRQAVIEKQEKKKEMRKARKDKDAKDKEAGNDPSNPGAGAGYIGSHKVGSDEKAALKRKQNKRMALVRYRSVVKDNVGDVIGFKWNVRLMCRWNDEHQFDPIDAKLMNWYGISEAWQKEFDEFDRKYNAESQRGFKQIFQPQSPSTTS